MYAYYCIFRNPLAALVLAVVPGEPVAVVAAVDLLPRLLLLA